ncbi:AAA ATPase-like domain-containing protein [Desulfonema limicola]|uniref:AAA ATPase-like domain-containing protein n=1 Tax=Desulfonema limicola TaxID=45656 RepID=A0A975BB04_9BACT|nr:AAA family ATPase [Desulfonema limicola]QTA82023.1 AAA ATPase-like domain-containing protein [Desulfonema limicola]
MKFPYGICDFREITMKNYFYCDRTDKIPLIEKGKYLLFLRPRRFGKSLLLSMLANYYDLAKKHEFEAMFGNLKIGKNPTELQNSYFIFRWDFSCVDSSGSVDDIKKALHDHINSCIKAFCLYYRDQLPEKVSLDWSNAINSINELITITQMSDHKIYLLIDEYDNFANQVMMGIRREKHELYEALVHEEGPLRTLFKAVKASASESLFDRIFITGVSPVVMSDITSGYNIAENIYLRYQFNDICGFTDNEIEDALKSIAGECDLSKDKVAEALELMKTYYNGYKFSLDSDTFVYNPTLSTYFLKYFYEDCKYPRQMLDGNLATDEAKLEYISQAVSGRQLLLDLLRKDRKTIVSELTDRFGIKQMLTDKSKDHKFMAAFLYYFGVLTMKEETSEGKISLKIPNLVIRGLYAEQICEMLLPEPVERDEGKFAAEKLYQKGDMQPLCDFVEQHYFKVFSNRDYKWANELTVKTAFLTLLYNDILYIMDTETEIDRRYSDLSMIIRPDMRRFTILDILVEFKFVKLKDAKLSGEQAKKLTKNELQNLPLMQAQMEDAKIQVKDYGDVLDKRHGNLRLRKYAVVSLGFERIWWEEVL